MNVASVSCIGRNIGPKTKLIKKDGVSEKRKDREMEVPVADRDKIHL